MKISRRKFLGSSASAVIVAGTMARGKVFGANEAIQLCCVGIHGRGGSHIEGFMETGGAEVYALCDVDGEVLRKKAHKIKRDAGKSPKTYVDIREALADDSIDAISIATPNHWHALMSIWACQAGKDVYVEKPLSHNVWEGRQLVHAAKKCKRVVQHGTQSRSSADWMRDIKLMHDGFIGKINMAKGFTYKNGNRHAIGHRQVDNPPPSLDWNLWQGPAQLADYYINKDIFDKFGRKKGLYVHYNWHWAWPYGNGEIGNQGVHQMDIANWGLNRKTLPVQVYSSGGRFAWDDDGETPNTQTTTYTYADGGMMVFEVRNLGSYKEGDKTTGNHFFGDDGYYVQGQGFFDYQGTPIPLPAEVETPKQESVWKKFVKAVRSRNPEDNPCDALEGHMSSAHCHLGNVAYRLKRSLNIDPAKECFINDEDANALLTRDYRKPFVVPEIG